MEKQWQKRGQSLGQMRGREGLPPRGVTRGSDEGRGADYETEAASKLRDKQNRGTEGWPWVVRCLSTGASSPRG